MKKITTNREILLLAGSSFFKRDWCEINTSNNDKKLSQKEQLIKLCWNGMLKDMLPEICQTPQGANPLPLWEINESGSMLDLRFGDFNDAMVDEWSINPYVYLTFAELN